jgi:hypothetical protein
VELIERTKGLFFCLFSLWLESPIQATSMTDWNIPPFDATDTAEEAYLFFL